MAKKKSRFHGSGAKPKYLGVKLHGGQKVKIGQVIVRQRGTRIYPGKLVGMGKDHTLFVKGPGVIKFHYGPRGRKYVSVISY